ncbi:hypothetical protein IX324_003043 [Bacteroides pyogenes]|nr:hypothetical protein [Bacteroides pyogenes]
MKYPYSLTKALTSLLEKTIPEKQLSLMLLGSVLAMENQI